MNPRYLEAAQAELDEAFDWYQSQRPGLGDEFLDEFNAAIKRVLLCPEAFPRITRDIRRALVKRFPYGVLFGHVPESGLILIVAVAHLHREPSYWLERLGDG